MQIRYLKSVSSTQTYLSNSLKKSLLSPPIAVVADIQTSGLGSRGNSWSSLDGNLFLSFAFAKEDLPDDLHLESSSIYFAYLLKQTLADCGSKAWLKWPNDLYLKDKKIGGVITTLSSSALVCGIGLNMLNAPKDADRLDIEISRDELMEKYFKKFDIFPKWKEIFRQYSLEFDKNKNFSTHNSKDKISLSSAVLCENGSILVDEQRIYSLR